MCTTRYSLIFHEPIIRYHSRSLVRSLALDQKEKTVNSALCHDVWCMLHFRLIEELGKNTHPSKQQKPQQWDEQSFPSGREKLNAESFVYIYFKL